MDSTPICGNDYHGSGRISCKVQHRKTSAVNASPSIEHCGISSVSAQSQDKVRLRISEHLIFSCWSALVSQSFRNSEAQTGDATTSTPYPQRRPTLIGQFVRHNTSCSALSEPEAQKSWTVVDNQDIIPNSRQMFIHYCRASHRFHFTHEHNIFARRAL